MRVLANVRLCRGSLAFLLLITSASGQDAKVTPQTVFIQSVSPVTQPVLLTPSQLEGLLPATVYFRGKSAPIQLRNAAGIRFGSDGYVLAAMVDTSGYASSVQETYQLYLITEVAVTISGQRLSPGAYGAGLVNGKFTIMDVGGHNLLQANATLDENMKRPRPLQLVTDSTGSVRLYLGRSWIGVTAEGTP
jgi:hypothetical protein